MPLKLIYGKTPLTEMHSLMLRPGQVHMENEMVKTLAALLDKDVQSHPARWEAAIRLNALLGRNPEGSKVGHCMQDLFLNQQEDGAFAALGLEDMLHAACAAWAWYELQPAPAVLKAMMSWCGYLAAHWDEAMACADIRVCTGDLMALLCNLYRVTGRKALLQLCEKLRRDGMDWSGVLNTFSVQRPMKRIIPAADLARGMAEEKGEPDGFYTRQYLTCHGETMADGARASLLNAVYSGNGSESTAVRTGWEKISRWHGAVCGGVTADETLAGASPDAGIDSASVGAWAEAFALQMTGDNAAWACDELEKLLVNAMPAVLTAEGVAAFQQVNNARGESARYHVSADQPERALTRLARGCAAACYGAVTAAKTGADVHLYLPGQYTMKMGDTTVRLTLSGDAGEYTLTVNAKAAVKAALRLHVPAWTDDAYIRVNDEGADEGRPGTYLTLERTWQDGDAVTVRFARKLRVAEGYHQSATVLYGAQVMALEGENWAVALKGEPSLKDGAVVASLAPVEAWKGESPVLPAAKGDAAETVLVPYAQAKQRMAQFPRCKA